MVSDERYWYWYLLLDSKKQETIADTLMQLSLSYAEIVQKIGKQDDRTCRIALKSFAKNKNWRILCTEGTPRSSIGRHVVRHIYRPTLRRCLCQHYYCILGGRVSVFRFTYVSTAYRLICRPIVLVGMIIRPLIDRQANDMLGGLFFWGYLFFIFLGFLEYGYCPCGPVWQFVTNSRENACYRG